VTLAFENLCGEGKPLKAEPYDEQEFAGLLRLAYGAWKMRSDKCIRWIAVSI
jgi:hypothetical protein